jgi:hypothetical protein
LFLLILVGYGLFTHTDHLGRLDGDNAYYLLMAQYFAEGEHASAAASSIFAQAFYPPFYPLWLALWGGGRDLAMAHFSTVLYLWLALLMWWCWARLLGTSRVACAALVIFQVAMPGMLLHSLEILSEFAYLALSMVGLYAVARWQRSPLHHGWLWLACVTVALALLTRSIGVALWLGWVGWLMGHGRVVGWRWSGILAAVPLLPALAWSRWHAVSFNYAQQFVERWSDPAQFGSVLREHAYALYVGWLENFSPSFQMTWPFLGLAGLCAIAAFWRARHREWDGYYVLGYFGVLLLWPFPGEMPRFLLAIVPVMMWQAMALVSRFTGHGWRAPRLLALLAGLSCLALGSVSILVQPASVLPPELKIYHRHADWLEFSAQEALPKLREQYALEQMLTALGQQPALQGQCLYSPKPSITSWYTGLAAVRPPPADWTDAQFAAWAETYPCEYMLVLPHETPSFPAFYPRARFSSLQEVSVAGPEGHGPRVLRRVTGRQ